MPDDTLSVKSPLPIERFGLAKRQWIKLQIAGLSTLAGLAREPIRVDTCRILGATNGRPLFRVTLSRDGIPAAGGSLVSASSAAHKAFAELCENLLLFGESYELGQTRSGFAADENETSAKERAYCELIERDSLITHFLCPDVRSFPLPRPEYAALPIRLARLWSADSTISVVLCGLKDNPDGPWFLGAGAEREEDVAIEKAYVECVSIYCSYRHASDIDRPLGPRQAEILGHIAASKEPTMNRSLTAIFEGSGAVTPNFQTSVSEAAFRTLARFGRAQFVVAASHSSLCPLTFGPLWARSEHDIVGKLTSRNLAPIWGVHPFA